ncbi:hypothetical protein, partial [Candidatus Magnetaquicoccus inordinatus]|uniref:hypothetical protein n=1 Tax=Candidatus Magnetaquicoccus inordinatus TaxID=2496818 RepID=UPI001D0E3238
AFAHAAPICAPEGHSLGGRTPDLHSLSVWQRCENFKLFTKLFTKPFTKLFRFVLARQLYPHGDAVCIGAKMRANTHSLLPLGALRRRKNRVGLV